MTKLLSKKTKRLISGLLLIFVLAGLFVFRSSNYETPVKAQTVEATLK